MELATQKGEVSVEHELTPLVNLCTDSRDAVFCSLTESTEQSVLDRSRWTRQLGWERNRYRFCNEKKQRHRIYTWVFISRWHMFVGAHALNTNVCMLLSRLRKCCFSL